MKLSVLGSTGSIGEQTLDVCRQCGYEVVALCANKSVDKIERQIREFKPKIAVLTDKSAANELEIKAGDTDTKIYSGKDGLTAAVECSADTVLNALVGSAGLVPTVRAINAGKKVALANKETLVAAGEYVMTLARKKGVPILPVDSEHSAIFQCLQGADGNPVKRVILTASGGPFFGKSREELREVKPKDALRHPNWDMGQKITIDSATMMNKGLEVIEAVHLFGIDVGKVEVVVHRESIIHSAVEYADNSVIAQLGLPSMKIPIAYALSYPSRVESPAPPLDLATLGKMTFFPPDDTAFGCLSLCKKAIEVGGLAPAAVNAANEVAVQLFLKEKIPFLKIEEIVESALYNQKKTQYNSIDEVLEADTLARQAVLKEYNLI